MGSQETPTMIDEEELQALLATDAERFDVPADGLEKIRTAVRSDAGRTGEETLPSVAWARSSDRRTGRGAKVALAGVAAAVVLALLISTVGHDGDNGSRASVTPASSSGTKELSAPVTSAPAGLSAASTTGGSATAGGATGSARTPSPAAPARKTPTGRRTLAKSSAKDSPGSEKIVKTGAIELRVPRRTFSARVARLTTLARGYGGFVAETNTSEQGDAPSGSVTLRVPAARFEDLLVQVRRQGRVRSATTGAQDVTTEYTDITGRLKTMKDERGQLSLVLTDAKNVPDILAVRDRLNAVQAEIEQLQGRQQVLDDQTSLATLTVALQEPGATKPLTEPRPARQSGLGRAWHRAVHGFTGGIEAIVAGSGKVLLVLLCVGVLWLFGLPLWRRLRRSLV